MSEVPDVPPKPVPAYAEIPWTGSTAKEKAMEHRPALDRLTEAAGAAAQQQGSGDLLRIVLIVMILGCVLVGWLLLRGYRRDD
jgi:hypothetical protein